MRLSRYSLRQVGFWTLAAVLVLGATIQSSYAQNGGPSGIITALAIDPANPATLYAGTYGDGAFKSTNGGTSWFVVSSGLTNNYVQALAIDPDNPTIVYAGTDGGGVYKTTNGGMSWTNVKSGLDVWTLAVDPSTPATIYAGTRPNGIFKSTDAGTTWTTINSGLTQTNVTALEIDPFTSTTLYAGTISGVFKSTNGGTSWSLANSGVTGFVYALAIDPAISTTLYAGTYGDGVFKSTDGATSWTAVSSGLGNFNVFVLAIEPAALYAGTINGVFKTTNGGNSWFAVNSGLVTHGRVMAMAIDPSTPAALYAGQNVIAEPPHGVFKSTNAGMTWQPTGTSTGGLGPATKILKVTGDFQGGLPGQPLHYPFVVVVTDANGIPVVGVTVDFAVQVGGGTLSYAQVITDPQGVALTTLTLGPVAGINIVMASSEGLSGSPLTFVANKKARSQLISH